MERNHFRPGQFYLPDKEFRLDLLHQLTLKGWSFLPTSACRHAARTLSSLTYIVSAWRIVSEDSGFRQSFLLIICTQRIVTVFLKTSSVGYSDVPAYSQVSLRQRFHLRTVIVTAAIHWGFGSELRALRP